MFFSLPVMILSTIFGAIVAEKWLGKRSGEASLRAGAGAAVGFVLGTVARFGCALVMVLLYGIAAVTFFRAAH